MANEVSSYFLRAVLEAGELFGKSRTELLAKLPNPVEADKRWGSVDWDDFLRVFEEAIQPVGTGDSLVSAGNRYMRERHGTRTAHLYGQFLSWDRVLWVAKHFMAPKLMKGYSIDYEKLGKNHFVVTMSIPEDLTGSSDFFYYLAGLWTGSSRQANLQHDLKSLSVTPHSVTAEILLDHRSLRSRLMHNPVFSAFFSWMELRWNLRDLQVEKRAIQRQNSDLQKALDAVADQIWSVTPHSVSVKNFAASRHAETQPEEAAEIRAWIRDFAAGVAPPQRKVGETLLRLRLAGTIPSRTEKIVILSDETHRAAALRQAEQAPETTRAEATEILALVLDSRLHSLETELGRAERAENLRADSRNDVRTMIDYTKHCRERGSALLQSDESFITSAEDFHQGLETLCENFRTLFQFKVATDGIALPVAHRPQDLRELFLICQECLRNAWRHSGGSSATLRFSTERLEVLDDGKGLGEGTPSGGLGLGSIRERAAAIGLNPLMAEPPDNGWIFTKRKGGP